MGQVKTLQRQRGSSTVRLFDAPGTPLWLNNDRPDVIEKILTYLGLWPHSTHATPRAAKVGLYLSRAHHKSMPSLPQNSLRLLLC
jgi:hypothetical protein